MVVLSASSKRGLCELPTVLLSTAGLVGKVDVSDRVKIPHAYYTIWLL